MRKELSFDSILVRLKADDADRRERIAKLISFDSILVRLKESIDKHNALTKNAVSIPYWFD